MPVPELMVSAERLAQKYPDWFIGVNCLGRDARSIVAEILQTDRLRGIWADDGCVDEREVDQELAADIRSHLKKWRGLYFGGVAFKYQRPVEDLRAAARMAVKYMDVVTTSGPGTGEAAEVEKIRIMKEAMGDYPLYPLGIASGITPENVEDYLPFATCYLVATGISRSDHDFDPEKVKRLLDTVRSA
jgi:predicted TIM-barrel enzyme